jgi:hypothetical protein
MMEQVSPIPGLVKEPAFAGADYGERLGVTSPTALPVGQAHVGVTP